jgi:hypothetical protein
LALFVAKQLKQEIFWSPESPAKVGLFLFVTINECPVLEKVIVRLWPKAATILAVCQGLEPAFHFLL